MISIGCEVAFFYYCPLFQIQMSNLSKLSNILIFMGKYVLIKLLIWLLIRLETAIFDELRTYRSRHLHRVAMRCQLRLKSMKTEMSARQDSKVPRQRSDQFGCRFQTFGRSVTIWERESERRPFWA